MLLAKDGHVSSCNNRHLPKTRRVVKRTVSSWGTKLQKQFVWGIPTLTLQSRSYAIMQGTTYATQDTGHSNLSSLLFHRTESIAYIYSWNSIIWLGETMWIIKIDSSSFLLHLWLVREQNACDILRHTELERGNWGLCNVQSQNSQSCSTTSPGLGLHWF